jgi:putative SOS response-associated peptidase YedK
MIITEPNAFVAEVHDRMPWLRNEVGLELLKPAPEDLLRRSSQRVNSSKAPVDDPTLIEQITI